jgi:hypothetical protein
MTSTALASEPLPTPRPGLRKARRRQHDAECGVKPWQRTEGTCGASSGSLRCTRGEGHGGLHEQTSAPKAEDLEAGRDGIRESAFFA